MFCSLQPCLAPARLKARKSPSALKTGSKVHELVHKLQFSASSSKFQTRFCFMLHPPAGSYNDGSACCTPSLGGFQPIWLFGPWVLGEGGGGDVHSANCNRIECWGLQWGHQANPMLALLSPFSLFSAFRLSSGTAWNLFTEHSQNFFLCPIPPLPPARAWPCPRTPTLSVSCVSDRIFFVIQDVKRAHCGLATPVYSCPSCVCPLMCACICDSPGQHRIAPHHTAQQGTGDVDWDHRGAYIYLRAQARARAVHTQSTAPWVHIPSTPTPFPVAMMLHVCSGARGMSVLES